MKLVCTKKCFFQNRLWSPGETLDFPDGQKVPAHFADKYPQKTEAKVQEPKTLHDYHKQEVKEALRTAAPSAPEVGGTDLEEPVTATEVLEKNKEDTDIFE